MNLYKSPYVLLVVHTACILLLVLGGNNLLAADKGQVELPKLTAKPGEVISLPLTVKNVDNLAGLKIILNYDSDLLNYKGLQKADIVKSLMHTVNSGVKDKLIVVMAGAKGKKIENAPVLKLKFKLAPKGFNNKQTINININSIKIMSDELNKTEVDLQHGKIKVEQRE